MPNNQVHAVARPNAEHTVTPAKAGVEKSLKTLDSGFRRNDGKY